MAHLNRWFHCPKNALTPHRLVFGLFLFTDMAKFTLQEWIVYGETGVSSKTMWAAITGSVIGGQKGGMSFDVPHDPSDFRRCLLFVQQCDITKEQLQRVKAVFNWFAPFIDNWDRLLELWDEESPSGRCPKLYKYMSELEDESRVLAGYERVSPGCWRLKQD